MTAEDIRRGAAFEDELMRQRIAAGKCPKCGWPHNSPEDDMACERQWAAKTRRAAARRVDGLVVYAASGALDDGES